ncbi:MAG: ATP phosphoribosyltransferase regulatory subunit [Sphaerochaetaceae bacterium]|nr:ATP phosphoribosyltransferase regulatory subunit [Sphaerochaetaceae bacterium]
MAQRKIRLKGEEKVVQDLRALYLSYGYSTYKMSRFEEYDLYAGNKDFLVSGNIITFTDTDGSLMALKPDVTLSIVKSIKNNASGVARVCYDENVYRVSDRSGTFREIMQAGLECIGDIGLVELGEVALLAQKSLKTISDNSILTISHMGIVEGFVNTLSSEEAKTKALEYLQARNLSALEAMQKDYPCDAAVLNKLASLVMLVGTNDEVFAKLQDLGADEASIKELRSVVSVLDPNGMRIDFSVLGEMNYYNGITLRGYIQGVPGSVISGGQYDKLMARMGKKAKAIGFAVYMDSLEKLLETVIEYDVDTVLVYDDTCSMKDVLAKADQLRESGSSVAAMKSIPQSLRYRETVVMEGGCNA